MPHPPRTLTHGGESLTLNEWAARLGIHAETIRCRVDHLGWPVERALTAPPDRRFAARGNHSPAAPRPCPPLRHHRASGQAYSRWQVLGRRHYRYFGEWGSESAGVAYKRFQAEWSAGHAETPVQPGEAISLDELVERYLGFVDGYYVKNGRWTSERTKQRIACGFMLSLYHGITPSEFTPHCLRAVQVAMVAKGWVRETINQHTWRIVRCFEWGVGQSLVPPEVHLRLKAVDYLQPGRTSAPDRPPILSVPMADLEATIPHLHADTDRRRVLEDMVRFHLLTGMRPAELCGMRVADLDRSGEIWRYTVPAMLNKNAHRERPQWYWIGPKAIAIVSKYLDGLSGTDRIWRFPAKRPGGKETPISRGAYGEFVRLACDRAKVARWHPHQLRHNRATDVQRQYEDNAAAAAAIGDTPEVTSEVYVDPADSVRRRIAKEMG